jgi:hypothetical protein
MFRLPAGKNGVSWGRGRRGLPRKALFFFYFILSRRKEEIYHPLKLFPACPYGREHAAGMEGPRPALILPFRRRLW